MAVKTVQTHLDDYTRAGDLIKPLADGVLICTACGHLCKLRPGQRGICKVRFNEKGTLRVPTRYTAGLHNDPIEKKPFFHVLPGTLAMSFGMLGCDFHCAYCQNWFTSQSLKDDSATLHSQPMTPAQICDLAERQGSKTVVSTYNEPLITSEWAVEVFQEAKSRGFYTAYVSNGHATPEVLEYLHPWLDFFKIDLKGFSEKNYRRLGGNLPAVLDSIREVYAMGFWMELVTLVVPEYNDSDQELGDIAEFIASVSEEIPWHVTAFHPDYKMADRDRTPAQTLLKARELGKRAGLHYIYSGNLPGQVQNAENTDCPRCGEPLIERHGFRVFANHLKNGACPSCEMPIPGRWH